MIRSVQSALWFSAAAVLLWSAAPPCEAQVSKEIIDELVSGRRLADEKSYDKALETARRIIAMDAGNPAGHHLEGLALYGLGRIEEACSAYSKSLDLSMGNEMVANAARSGMALCRHSQAFDEFSKGNYDRALELISIALYDDPRNVSAQLFRGRIIELLGSPDRALAEYRAVLEQNPSEAQAYYYIAKTCLGMQDFAAAVDAFGKYLMSDGGDPAWKAEAHYYSGEAARDGYDFRKAASHFRKALDLSPGMEPAAKSLAAVEERMAAVRAASSAERKLLALALGLAAAACAGLAVAARRIGPGGRRES